MLNTTQKSWARKSVTTRIVSWLTTMTMGLVFAVSMGCNERAEESGKPRVVATFSVLGDLTAEIGGEHIELATLVGPDGDAHTFEPTPRDPIAIARADVIIEIGLGFETWLDGLVDASGTDARRVVVSRNLELIRADHEEHDHRHHPHDHDHDHAIEYDPHIWHDVPNVIYMVGRIRDALAEADPDHADDYGQNAAALIARLETLHAWVKDQVATLPEANRKLVTSHDTFGYFARRYGFDPVGSALDSLSTEAADPSAAEVAELCETIRREKVPAIFGENIKDSRLMEQIARETGVKVVPTLYTDALGPPGSPGATYEGMIRHNVTTIVEALRP